MWNIKGLDSAKYFWFEEAHNISGEIIRLLIPSIRAEDSQIIITLNPLNTNDYIYQNYILKDGKNYHIAIKVNYTDNPFFPNVMERDRVNDYNNLPRPLYLNTWEGEVNDYNDMLVIDVKKIKYYNDEIEYKYTQIVLSLDTAYSVKTSADYSVIAVLGACDNGDFHLINISRGQWDFFTLKEMAKSVYMTISGKYRAPITMLIENKASGQSLVQELQRETNLPIITTTPIVDKFNRVVNDLLPYINKLYMPMSKQLYNSWIPLFLNECSLFRSDGKHEHDDMIDAVNQGLKYLNRHNLDYAKIKDIFNNLNTQDF